MNVKQLFIQLNTSHFESVVGERIDKFTHCFGSLLFMFCKETFLFIHKKEAFSSYYKGTIILGFPSLLR